MCRFDLVKVRIQTQVPGPDGTLPYTGAIDCVKKTISREGPRALYKGMSAPLGGVVPIFSLCFLAYDAAKSFIKGSYGFTTDKQLSLFQIGVAGAASAIPTTAIMAPGERIKCILQVQDAQVSRCYVIGALQCLCVV
jgi:solute carrier family 25 (mitochondrial carnitine/acylcarnitine transporter), member 20/29